MAHITYHVVEHDGGWAYKVGDVFSETFRSHAEALEAAKIAAAEQQAPGEDAPIAYQDGEGRWREETAKGSDRPETDVSDET